MHQPQYRDPKDRRLVQIIKKAKTSQQRAVNILGIPFDGAVLGRKGSAGGPAAIRQSLSFFSNYDPDSNSDFLKARVFDLGDLVPESDDVISAHSRIQEVVERELDAQSLLVILGGDNSVSLPSLRAFSRRFGKMGLVVIDSHLDLRGMIGGKPTSGSSYGLAIESIRDLDPRRVVEIGVHGFLNSRSYADKATRLGVECFPATAVRKMGVLWVAREAYEIAAEGAKAVYVSIDMDAVDLSSVSGVSSPSIGGISAAELMELARHFAGREKTKCADIVELAPVLDPTGRSQIVAATCLVNLISGFTMKGKAGL